MIRKCNSEDLEEVYEIINDAARVYQRFIPAERWREPYMPFDELCREVKAGVVFWGYGVDKRLAGVMGLQVVQDVNLIRHAYVRTDEQHLGIGGKLLAHLYDLTTAPVLIGTWRDAYWAVSFYQKHGFRLVPQAEKDLLLRKYWTAAEWHMEMSVVLADRRWCELHKKDVNL